MSESQRVFDELLVLLAQSGDRAALAELARRWYPRLVRSARRILSDEELAREAAQDSWISIQRGVGRVRKPSRFPGWAFGILRRRCADEIGRAVRRRQAIDPAPAPQSAHPADQGERLAIERAFAALGPNHRVAATLFFVERLTLDEIAVATGVPVGTVKSRLFHARKALKAQLQENGNA